MRNLEKRLREWKSGEELKALRLQFLYFEFYFQETNDIIVNGYENPV